MVIFVGFIVDIVLEENVFDFMCIVSFLEVGFIFVD